MSSTVSSGEMRPPDADGRVAVELDQVGGQPMDRGQSEGAAHLPAGGGSREADAGGPMASVRCYGSWRRGEGFKIRRVPVAAEAVRSGFSTLSL